VSHGQVFKALHAAKGGFIMPNAWDAGSAAVLAAAGFRAIATTSAGIAFSLGKQDYRISDPALAVSREEMFDRIQQIVSAVGIPVSADLEAGYGDSPQDVAETIARAMEAGLAGANLEDKRPDEPGLYDEAEAVERIAAAREAIDARGGGFVLTARTDAMQVAPAGELALSIRRLNLFHEAGADCLYAPGASDLASVRTLVREVEGPLNVVIGLGNARGNARELLAAGVQRISLGGCMARAALGFVGRCAAELRDSGTIGFVEDALAHAELNALFAGSRRGDRVLSGDCENAS
jgi:2-methylisocitrate lyase-like PEP mutase family enzyme